MRASCNGAAHRCSPPPGTRARRGGVPHPLWNKTDGQATVTIRDATLAALPAILDPTQDGYHDTNNPDNLGSFAQHPLLGSMA